LAAALVGLFAIAGSAQAAAPSWKLLAVTGPTNLPPKQSETQRVSVEAEGGTFTLSPTTGEGEGTLRAGFAFLELVEGSNEANLVAGTPTPGEGLIGFGVPDGTTIVSVVGSTVTLSNAAETTGFEFFTTGSKEVTGVSASAGGFLVGDGISGDGIPAGTVITSAGSGTLTLSQFPTAEGIVSLTASETTAPIAFDASGQAVQEALEALPGFASGMFSVSGGPGGSIERPYFIGIGGPLAEKNVSQIVADGSALVGEHASANVFTVVPGGPGTGIITINPANIGGAPTSGEYTIELGPLPAGIITSGPAQGSGWSCPGDAGDSIVTCTSTSPVSGLTTADNVTVPVKVEPAAATTSSAPVTISGGNAASASFQMPVVVSTLEPAAGVQAFWAGSFDADGNSEIQAGGHPYSAQSYFLVNTVRSSSGRINPAGDSKNVIVDLPPGFLGNPLATPRCPQSQVTIPTNSAGESPLCNEEMSVGRFSPIVGTFGSSFSTGQTFGIYNDVPAHGYAAEFTTKIAIPIQSLLGSVRSSEDFGVRITAPNNPNYLKIYGAFAALKGEPAGAQGKAFMRNATDCEEMARQAPVASAKYDTWQAPGIYTDTIEEVLPPVTGCDQLEFLPSFSFQPTSTQGSSPVGATVRLHLSQEGLSDPSKLATPDLKRAVVTLPQGLTLNPSSANGLQACSEAQIGYRGNDFELPNPIRFDEESPSCPDGSKLGTIEVETPLLEAPLRGTIYLASQEENPFGSLIAIYLVVDDARTGIVLKLPGEVKPDPNTGQLTATFDYNPQLPFEDFTLHFRGGGPRSQLATPEVCGTYRTTGALTPWSAPESGPPAEIDEAGFTVNGGCSSSPEARPFSPSFEAGTTGPQAGSYSPLVVKVNRNDGEQELTRLDFTLPKGLIGKLAGIPYCSDAAIATAASNSGKTEQANPSCPASSQIGSVDSAVGVGSEPFHVGGHVYLAGPYKGAPISSVVITPGVAGPFDLGNVVVRAPLYINSESAQLTVKSDPIPTILKGIPLKLRSVAINVDRPGFVLNPTSCEPMSASASIAGGSGATATPSNRFQVGSCSSLKFTPKLKLALKGGTRRNGNPALTAILTQPPGQANIGKVSVALPHSEFLDQSHIRTICTRVQFAADQCPKAAIYGHAEAVTPLLDQRLRGPVYLRSSNNELPDLVVALRGPAFQPIEVDLVGRIDSVNGGIRNSFELLPDAPVSKFVLRMQGGKKGLLVNSTNLCRGTHNATVKMRGQNGKTRNFSSPLKAQCKKRNRQ